MAQQAKIKRIKKTAINIRTFLHTSNKTLERLDTTKVSLLRKQREQALRAAQEKKVEAKGKKSPIKGVLGNIGSNIMSMWDRIMNFFGYLLIGWLGQHLPAILKTLKTAFDFVAPLVKIAWNVISTIAKALWRFGGWITSLFNKKQATKNLSAIDESAASINKEVKGFVIPGQVDEGGDNKEPQKTLTSEETLETIKEDGGFKEDQEVNVLQQQELKQISQNQPEEESPLESLANIDPASIIKNASGGGSTGSKPKLSNDVDVISDSIENKTKSIIHRVDKTIHDLKGNIDDSNIKTIIMPIEVEKIVSAATGSKGSLPIAPPPAVSTNNSMRIP